MKLPFSWGILSMIVSAIGVGVEYMSGKEEEEAREHELDDIKKRLNNLENQDKTEVKK